MGSLKVNGTIWSEHPSESQIGVNFNNKTLYLYNNNSFGGLYDTAFGSVIRIENGTGVMEFAGNSYSATILKLYQTGGSATGVGDWEPSTDSRFSHFHTVYKQKWTNSNLNNDTGDLVLTLRNGNSSDTEMCMFIDGDYYAMGFYKVLNELNYSNYALPLTGGTMSGTIWSNHVYPTTTMSYNFGSADYEYNATFSRTVFVRHLEPAKNVNDDIYINYGSRNGCIRAYTTLSMEGIGNIVNLPIGGGIYWNPYVESSTDGTDAASITIHKNGVAGGTELRISMRNDGDDVINFDTASWIYLNGNPTFHIDDSWLRINETSSFGSGIYTGNSCIRSDNQFQVGDSGTAFLARIDGYGRFKYKLDIGAELSLWADNEGGNIWLHSGNGHTNAWEIDSYNGNLRIYTYRESDGVFMGQYLDQNTARWSAAEWANVASYSHEAGSSYKIISTGELVTNTLQYLCTNSAFDYGNWQYDIIMNHGGGDYRTILQFPYWGTPRYRKMESSVWGNYQNFHTTENVVVQSNTPGAGFHGQIWLQI